MKTLTGLLVFALAVQASAQRLPASSGGLTTPRYSFDPAKLAVAKDSFHFLRSYVDYYYLLVHANPAKLPTLTSLNDQAGWCVGDAHPENFGAVIQDDGSSVFAMNDIDDAGPCPVVYDLARLMVSSELYKGSVDQDDLLKAYRDGLEGQHQDKPDEVKDLLKESQKKGERPEHSRVNGNQLVRSSGTDDVSASIRSELEAVVGKAARRATLVDALETSKVGGGSGGLRRYELLVQDSGGLVELELKQEITPSIYPVATSAIPAFAARMKKTLTIEQGSGFSSYDGTYTVDGLSMILRPRFAGNEGVDLSDNKKKANFEIINYEAYVLGQTHAASINGPAWAARLKSVDKNAFEADIDTIVDSINQTYDSVK